ncbi:MAG: molybdenum cofactor guanylyltransferase [Neisseriaceae bacterium]|nr:molybdenum cofactor guanylyltransferase [Neisseriaceae bacterium]
MTTPKPAGKPNPAIGALILAGGLATRMQGVDKGLVPFMGQPLVTHLLPVLTPYCDWLGISANRNQDTYQAWAPTVFADAPAYAAQGPLAGLASAPAHLPALDWLVVLPCDTPMLPPDLIPRFLAAADARPHVLAWYADTDDGPQPSIMLLRPQTLASLPDYLARGERTLRGFLAQHQAQALHFPETEAFANGNRPQDLARMAAQE